MFGAERAERLYLSLSLAPPVAGKRRGWKPIYEGADSVYARMEGVYVPKRGIRDIEAAASIAALILRDYSRGWTYDHYGNVIGMNWDLARRRLLYLVPLAVKHGARDLDAIRDLAYSAAATGRLPPEYARYVVLAGPQAARVLAEVAAVAAPRVAGARKRVAAR